MKTPDRIDNDPIASLCTSFEDNEPAIHTFPSMEPIAIIGLSCRLPGSAQDPSSFWEMLASGRSAWVPDPGERFNMRAFQDSTQNKADTTNACGGHFLKEDVAAFDTSFFGISPLEAKAMDPQQRLLLEIAYESFQNAGISTESLWGSDTGVFIGQWSHDYHEIQTRDTASPPLYLTTGTGPAILSNRVSYQFNLRGPSLTMDTGCSSSMVALHQAVCSLRRGETSMCFVGSTNLLLDPQRFVYQSKMKMFSPDGRSFSFDSRANGYGRGEGIAGLMLKPLSAAIRDGNYVRAVIRNSVLNQDGRTPGITVPNEEAQERAILKAYEEANLELFADYVEAHGTGTKAGDPKEASAIAATFTKQMTHGLPLPIGSVKGNIGHTEATSGLAAIIKAVLMLEKGMIPPQASFKSANPDLHLQERQLRIPTKLEKTPLRRISVNKQVHSKLIFGYGGTNCHVVIDAAPPPSDDSSIDSLSSYAYRIFFISAASEKSCQKVCSRLAKYIVKEHGSSNDADTTLSRLAYTLNNETVHTHRLGLVASNLDELMYQLSEASNVSIPRQMIQREPRIALVFSGQGAQYAEMGLTLLKTQQVFAQSLERASRYLKTLRSSWDLLEELQKPKEQSRINEPSISQPACTAIQVSLVELLDDLGITISAVLGHSSGEIAAAFAAGALSFEEALSASYFRGKLVADAIINCANPGAMLAVGADPATVNKRIDDISTVKGRVRIACYNSPSSVTVSGDAEAIAQLQAAMDKESCFNRKLSTDGAAYHSHQMELVSKDYQAALDKTITSKQDQETRSHTTRIFSSVTGEEVDKSTMANPSYWVTNLLNPVLFRQGLEVMSKAKFEGEHLDLIVEVGPHSQLRGPVQQTLKTIQVEFINDIAYTNTLSRGEDSQISILKFLATLKVKGSGVSLNRIHGFTKTEHPVPLINLPPYPFDHEETYWHETRVSRNYRLRPYLPHELLGSLVLHNNRMEPTWRHFLNPKESPWLLRHLIQGEIVFPAAGFIVMAEQAAKQHMLSLNPGWKTERVEFRNISINQALVFAKDGPDVEIVLSLRPEARTASESSKVWNEFRIFTVTSSDTWLEHCRGLVHAASDAESNDAAFDNSKGLAEIAEKCTHKHNAQKFYHLSRQLGIDWQDPFNNTSTIRTSKDMAVTNARGILRDADHGGVGDVIHPSLLDSCLFHGLCAIKILEGGATSSFVPFFIEELAILNRHMQSSDLVSTSTVGKERSGFDVYVQDLSTSDCPIVIEAHGVRTRTLPGDTGLSEFIKDISHSQKWVTFVDAWTAEHRDRTCKVNVPPGSATNTNQILDTLSRHFVQKTLKEVSPDTVTITHRRHFLKWMQEKINITPEISQLPNIPKKTLENSLVQGVLRLGPELPRILTNDLDPLTLLTPDNLLSRLYNTERAARCISQMAEYCHALGQQCSKLKILEVGAGTASATIPILEALNGRGSRFASRYDFTDVSPGFFSGAKDVLGDLGDTVVFSVLDVERDPIEQGFEESSYDLIIASNVIHATKSISPVVLNMRKLLKPGGRFMLMELMNPEALYYNLIFGVFEGWWAGYDEGRRLSPLLTRSQWTSELQLSGFPEPELLFEDYSEQDGGTLGVFVSREPVDAAPGGRLPPIHVVSKRLEEYASGLKDTQINLLKKQFTDTELSVHDVSTTSPGGNISIIMPDVAKFICKRPDEASWQSFKSWILKAHVAILVECTSSEGLDEASHGVWLGFARCVRKERPDIHIVTLDLDVQASQLVERLITVLPQVLKTIPNNTSPQRNIEQEDEFAEKDGELFVSRLIHNRTVTDHIHCDRNRADLDMVDFANSGDTLIAELGTLGLIGSLRWKYDKAKTSRLSTNDLKIKLKAASINFKDVLIAAGQLEGLTEMRNDCSGVVVEIGANMRDRYRIGDRVCALYSRSYTNYPIVHGDCCQVIPDAMSWEEAAAIPVVWTTVYYALVDMGRLSKGDSILIHSGAGAVGQAAIMLAQHIGATIFVTAGSDAKHSMLHDKYKIPREHLFSSRSTAFYSGIKALTGGHGVDVVLNSLSGEMFRYSCNIVAPFGRFVEIGRKDLMDDAKMPMSFLLNNISFSYVDMALIMDKQRPLARRLLRDVMDLTESGAIKSVTLSVMPISDIEIAFRQIQAGKHMGKIVLQVTKDQKVKAIPKPPEQAKFRHDATYIIAGGLGGLGRAIIQWMVERGAKYILCLSRSGGFDEQSQVFLNEMHDRGVKTIAHKCNIVLENEVSGLAQVAARAGFPAIRGVIQCATVAKDAPFEAMKASDWIGSLGPKVYGTLNLHRTFGSEIDFFLVMSSAVALHGSGGLSNYAAGCSFQDALVRRRVAAGMPSFSINAGSIQEVGFVSENPVAAATLQRHGLGAISILDLLAMLNYTIMHPNSGDSADNVCAIGLLPNNVNNSNLSARRFAFLQRQDIGRSSIAKENTMSEVALLHGAMHHDEAIAIVLRAILKQLSKLTAVPIESFNTAQPMQSYGVDSLVAVELRNWIGVYLQSNLPLMVLRGATSINELASIAAKESRILSASG